MHDDTVDSGYGDQGDFNHNLLPFPLYDASPVGNRQDSPKEQRYRQLNDYLATVASNLRDARFSFSSCRSRFVDMQPQQERVQLPDGFLVGATITGFFRDKRVDSVALASLLEEALVHSGVNNPDIRRTSLGVWVSCDTIEQALAADNRFNDQMQMPFMPVLEGSDFATHLGVAVKQSSRRR